MAEKAIETAGTAADPSEADAVPIENVPVRPSIMSIGGRAVPFAASVALVDGAKSAVSTLAKRLAGCSDSEDTATDSVEVSLQSVSAYGAQWLMASDLTPGTIYFVSYDRAHMSYFVDAYVHAGFDSSLTLPTEHSYA